MHIAPVIRYHRKKAGLSQNQLAKLAGIGKTAVFDLEMGKASAQLVTLLKVLHVLNIRLDWDSPLKPGYLKELSEKGDGATG